MRESTIPVDPTNPGQVLACLGFMEIAELLVGPVECRFDWSNGAAVRFVLRTETAVQPFEAVLDFLASCTVEEVSPDGVRASGVLLFPGRPKDTKDPPAALLGHWQGKPLRLPLSHWADGSSRKSFKLHAGRLVGWKVAKDMLDGTFTSTKTPKRDNDGLKSLLTSNRAALIAHPFDQLTALAGTYCFDARRGWTGLDAGYSPNEHKGNHSVAGSPVVELLAAIGLQHARPRELGGRRVEYFVWSSPLPPALARVALTGNSSVCATRRFQFTMAVSGKNKLVRAAQEV